LSGRGQPENSRRFNAGSRLANPESRPGRLISRGCLRSCETGANVRAGPHPGRSARRPPGPPSGPGRGN